MVLSPERFSLPHPVFLMAPLVLFTLNLSGTLYLYRTRMGCSMAQAMGGCIAAMGLSYTIARAFLTGLFTSHRPFLLTSKGNLGGPLFGNLLVAQEELVLVYAICCGLIVLLGTHSWNSLEAIVWLVLLATQSVPYLCAVVLSITSGLSSVAHPEVSPVPESPLSSPHLAYGDD